ncbi:TPR domain-containing protein [Colletotrichum chrysophilum]|uniref:TPR domain-containing protein n=1 Tax=Colletotrichum chrysophilum TaxID=1836956 RepID=A0AAD9E9X1_9PEZI|nr:TPR domain-containing protein [Colletotrichum chrysophilum]
MAPKLSKVQRSELQSIIITNIIRHGTIDPPRKVMGRPRGVTENMWLALQNQLERNPCMSQQDMADFLHNHYQFKVLRFTIGRTLKRAGWTKKVTQNIAKERNQDLWDDYIERRSHYKRVQVLPAYTINGVIYCEVYEENTYVELFECFLERLLPYCGRYPEPRSVIFMDNASFHFISQSLKDLFAQAGVIIEYQVPYSPDLNPIEYLFGSVKNRIRRKSRDDADLIQGDFKSYLQMQIRVMGEDKNVARGHFRKAQIVVDEP